MQEIRSALRPLWLVLIVLFALAAGVTGGLLAWIDMDRVAPAILTGGGTFAAAVALGMAVFHFLHEN